MNRYSVKSLLLNKGGSVFRRNFVSLLRANILAYALAFVAYPFLTRLYDPFDFGVLGLLVAASNILMNVATFRFDWSMPNARTKTGAAALFAWGLIALGITTVLTFLVLATGLGGILIASLESDELVRQTFMRLGFLLPVVVFALGAGELLNGWHVRENDMSSVSRSSVVQKGTDSGLSLIGGIASLGVASLLGAYVASFWVRGVALMWRTSELWSGFGRLSIRRMRCVLCRFFSEASWSTTVSLVNASSHTLPLVLISSFYSIKDAGTYFLVYRVALAPLYLVTRSLGSTYWAHAAQLYKSGDIRELNSHLIRTTRYLSLGIVPIVVVCGLAPFFVGPLFGEEQWAGAGYMLLALMPVLIAIFVYSPTHHLVALRRPSTQLFGDVLRVVMVVGSIVACGLLKWNVYIAVALSSAASFVGYLVLYLCHIRVHKQLIALRSVVEPPDAAA